MRKIMNIKDASGYLGISAWELRQGIKSGKYPAMIVGQDIGKSRGKYLVDIDMVNARIDELMLSNIKIEGVQEIERGIIRRIA